MKSTFHVAIGLAFLVVLAVPLGGNAAPPQVAQTPSAAHTPEHFPAKKEPVQGVGNFGEVTPTLYRGGQPSREGFEALAKMGVKIVVDSRLSGHDNERKEVETAGMQYVSIPWHCLFPRDEVFARFLAVLHDNPGKKVFVHCRYGEDRTGMMVAAYRMSVEGWTAEEARREMDQFGFAPLVCPSLGPYEKHFLEHVRKDPALQAPTNAPPAAN